MLEHSVHMTCIEFSTSPRWNCSSFITLKIKGARRTGSDDLLFSYYEGSIAQLNAIALCWNHTVLEWTSMVKCLAAPIPTLVAL